MQCDLHVRCGAVAALAPSQPCDHKGEQLIYDDHSIPIQQFCFSLLAQLRFSTRYYKRGFVLHDLPHCRLM